MGPESETTITPANLAAATNRFEAANGRFARAYAEGQNMFAPIRDFFIRRGDRAVDASTELRESQLQLAEYRGRNSVVTGTVGGFRGEVALGTAHAHQELSEEIVVTATEAVQTPGNLTDISRAWVHPVADAAKLVAAGGLAYASFSGIGYGNTADLISHGAVIAGGIAAMDLGRRIGLEASTRHAANLGTSVAELVRRNASMGEGRITGDYVPDGIPSPDQIISGELEDRAEDSLRDGLYANDIPRPALARYDAPWTARLRGVIRDSLSPFDPTQELIRARDTAARSRLGRTLLALALVGTVGANYITTRTTPNVNAENCPIITFPDPNLHAQQALNLPDVAHFSGIAKNMFFKRAYGVDFDHSPAHTELLNKLTNEDQVGNNRIINAIAGRLRTANPQVVMVTPDAFKLKGPNGESVALVGICDPRELNSIYNGAIQNP